MPPWGVRRYQNYDGSLIKSGKAVYNKAKQKIQESYKKANEKFVASQYKNYDGSLIKEGSAYRRKTKYTNIDGSLNEEGKIHSQKYINKQIKKNEVYYDKHIKKYEKLEEKYKDNPEMSNKFKMLKEDAIRSRDSVNASIKRMGIDEIMANEKEARAKALKVAGAIAAGTAIATGSGVATGLITMGIKNSSSQLSKCLKNFNPNAPMDTVIDIVNTTPVGRKAEQFANTAIRSYSDARAYVVAIYADQMLNRLNDSGITTKLGKMSADVVNTATGNIDQSKIDMLSNNLNVGLNSIIGNAANAPTTFVNSFNGAYNSALNNTITSTNDQVAILMNDPNYANLVTAMAKR